MDDYSNYKNKLEKIKSELQETIEGRKEAEKVVELDQTRTGRLTRMDALQSQSMAKETQKRAEQHLSRVKVALKRIEEDEYGYCVSCDEEISEGRLAADPAVLLCIECASKKEQNSR